MKRVSLFLLVSLSGVSPAHAQVDSLKQLVAHHTDGDSIRVDALVSLARAIVPSNPAQAKEYSDEALRLSLLLGWQPGIARACRMLGYYNYIVGDFLTAADYNLKAQRAVEPLGDRVLQGSILNNMGLVYSELSRFDEALDAYRRYLTIARELKMRREEAIAVMNTGLVWFKRQDIDSALAYYRLSLAIADAEGYTQVAAYTLSNMGAALNLRQDYSKGLAAFERSVALGQLIGDKRIVVQSVGGIGESHFHLGHYTEAGRYTQRALGLAREIGLLEYEKEMQQGLSEIYSKQGRYDMALEAYKRYIATRDSIWNDTKRQELRRKELQFAFEKKEALLTAEHAAELRQQETVRNAMIGGGVILALAGLTSFGFYKKRRDAGQRLREAEFQAQVSDTEMKALRAQMNPHFIFNSLNSIADFLQKHDHRSADAYLTKFAKLMRMTLEHSEQKEVPLADDLAALDLYLQLEALRLNRKFTHTIIVDPEVDGTTTMIPPLLLQPFVENSVWHGIARKEGSGAITVRVTREGEMINCIVEDDGVGRKAAATAPSGRQSLGLAITRARIDILNRLRHATAGVTIDDLDQGTRVEVRLPLVLQF